MNIRKLHLTSIVIIFFLISLGIRSCKTRSISSGTTASASGTNTPATNLPLRPMNQATPTPGFSSNLPCHNHTLRFSSWGNHHTATGHQHTPDDTHTKPNCQYHYS